MFQFSFGFSFVVVDLVVLVLHVMHLLSVLVLQLLVSLHELPLELLVPVIPFLLNGIMSLVVLFDIVVTLVVQILQLLLELVDGVLDLVDLLGDCARSVVPELVMVHPIVMLVQPVARGRALDDTIVFMVWNVLLNMVLIAMATQAQVHDLNRMIVHKDVDVEDDTAELEQIVGAKVQVDLCPSAEVWVLNQGQVVLHLAHVELLKSLDHVASSHLVSDLCEYLVDVMVSLLLRNLIKSGSLMPEFMPVECE